MLKPISPIPKQRPRKAPSRAVRIKADGTIEPFHFTLLFSAVNHLKVRLFSPAALMAAPCRYSPYPIALCVASYHSTTRCNLTPDSHATAEPCKVDTATLSARFRLWPHPPIGRA